MSGLFSGEQFELSFDVPMARMRVCRVCDEPKLDNDFHAWLIKPGRNPPCKTCYRKQKRRQYANSPATQKKARKQAAEYQRKLVSTPEGHAKKLEQKKRYRDSNKGQITNESHRKKYQPRRAQLAVKYKHQAKQSRKLTKRQCVELKRRIRRRLERNRLNLNEALRDWFCVQANDEWLDHWYGEVVPAWKDVRLTLNQRISMRYMDRYRNEPDFHLKERLARTLRNCLTKNQYRFSKSLGYHTRDVKQHIESQFTEAMSWEAFCDGAIHVDHIIPKVYFNHSIEREVVDCWSLANLQPLWAADNWSKRDSVDPSTADPTLWARYGDRVPVDKLTGPNSVEFS